MFLIFYVKMFKILEILLKTKIFGKPNQQQAVLAGVNTRGLNGCVRNGVMVRVDAHRQWISASAVSTLGVVAPALVCPQTLFCYSPECYQSLSPEAQALFDPLFLCAEANNCSTPECYPTACAVEYEACVGSI